MPRGLPPHGGLSSWIMSNQKHIVLAGGGTAGHVNPLLAVAHVIRELEPEADIAVAAASVLARAAFLQNLQELAQAAGVTELPKGAGPQVTEEAARLAQVYGKEALAKFVKLHFANTKALILA